MRLSSFLLYLNLTALVKYGEENKPFSVEWKHLSVSVAFPISDGFANSQGSKSAYFAELKAQHINIKGTIGEYTCVSLITVELMQESKICIFL